MRARPAQNELAIRVTIVTAGPLGAYHPTPLSAAIATSDASLAHLVPYEEPAEGHSAAVAATSVTVIDRCGRLIMTGGTLSAWAEIVARYAESLGTPIVFSELAYLDDCGPSESTAPIARAGVREGCSTGTVAHLLGPTHVEVASTSSPDNLPVRSPLPRRALLTLQLTHCARVDHRAAGVHELACTARLHPTSYG